MKGKICRSKMAQLLLLRLALRLQDPRSKCPCVCPLHASMAPRLSRGSCRARPQAAQHRSSARRSASNCPSFIGASLTSGCRFLENSADLCSSSSLFISLRSMACCTTLEDRSESGPYFLRYWKQLFHTRCFVWRSIFQCRSSSSSEHLGHFSERVLLMEEGVGTWIRGMGRRFVLLSTVLELE